MKIIIYKDIETSPKILSTKWFNNRMWSNIEVNLLSFLLLVLPPWIPLYFMTYKYDHMPQWIIKYHYNGMIQLRQVLPLSIKISFPYSIISCESYPCFQISQQPLLSNHVPNFPKSKFNLTFLKANFQKTDLRRYIKIHALNCF